MSVSVRSLEEKLHDANGGYTSRDAQLIDEIIFFYIPDELMAGGSDKEIEQYVIDNLEW